MGGMSLLLAVALVLQATAASGALAALAGPAHRDAPGTKQLAQTLVRVVRVAVRKQTERPALWGCGRVLPQRAAVAGPVATLPAGSPRRLGAWLTDMPPPVA